MQLTNEVHLTMYCTSRLLHGCGDGGGEDLMVALISAVVEGGLVVLGVFGGAC